MLNQNTPLLHYVPLSHHTENEGVDESGDQYEDAYVQKDSVEQGGGGLPSFTCPEAECPTQ